MSLSRPSDLSCMKSSSFTLWKPLAGLRPKCETNAIGLHLAPSPHAVRIGSHSMEVGTFIIRQGISDYPRHSLVCLRRILDRATHLRTFYMCFRSKVNGRISCSMLRGKMIFKAIAWLEHMYSSMCYQHLQQRTSSRCFASARWALDHAHR
mmetsp:Transcript_87953/g.247118  ORF Transcript_87953/g.247118 Transcript_87953/m.247118 type:complete len:151 (+) Transcript_87953:1440-1892(+)